MKDRISGMRAQKMLSAFQEMREYAKKGQGAGDARDPDKMKAAEMKMVRK